MLAQPVLLLFSVFRYLAFHLWLALTLVCGHHRELSPVTLKSDTDSSKHTEKCHIRSKEDLKTTLNEMENRQGPGPGDPVLAKQKHHHRKAFEYISKALKIDEEDKGNVSLGLIYYN